MGWTTKVVEVIDTAVVKLYSYHFQKQSQHATGHMGHTV